MTELISDLKGLRLYGMATRYAEWMQTGGVTAVEPAEALLRDLIAAEKTDRAIRSTAYQMRAAKFPIHRDLAGFERRGDLVERPHPARDHTLHLGASLRDRLAEAHLTPDGLRVATVEHQDLSEALNEQVVSGGRSQLTGAADQDSRPAGLHSSSDDARGRRR